MGVFLRQKGDLLVRNPQQQPSIQEAYHHKSFARSQRHLGLHDQRAARQGPRARQKIESSVTPHQPDRQPEQGQEQKKNAHGLHIAAPAERGLAERGDVPGRSGCGGLRGKVRAPVNRVFHGLAHDMPGLFQTAQHMLPGEADRVFQPRRAAPGWRRNRRRAVHQAAYSLARKARGRCRGGRGVPASQAASPVQWG